ncbi:hypothetical protein AWQ21_06380 [Picosynechococcus sp. PCC 7003]|uniref:hypothetical protein n=1 Tax=Picosynechococcus sp. PCC 7003 TaxID=374981 RepID=UPI0008105EEE|nr:hypothetical protein [Picosynechococcus sp. PCC 7003]ANV84038.1 hypothetical protein AWQ21_06380 [Picosynechococcus sp. PCC 7003]
MARYTCSYFVGLPEADMLASLKEIIQECDLNLAYETGGYIMAKEKPGNVSFTKLVELEVLFDRNKIQDGKLQVDFVAKNEELPLHIDNHCRAVFDMIQKKVSAQQPWQLETDTAD